MRWCPTVNNDLEVLATPALATQYETLVRVSRAIGAHRDLKELFGILMDELYGVVQFDLIGARHLCEAIHRSRASIAIRIASTLSTFSTSSTSTFSTSVVFS